MRQFYSGNACRNQICNDPLAPERHAATIHGGYAGSKPNLYAKIFE
jgi:hypothetical protein